MTLVEKQDTGHRVAEQCEAYRDDHKKSRTVQHGAAISIELNFKN
jgi:hypothetical protein